MVGHRAAAVSPKHLHRYNPYRHPSVQDSLLLPQTGLGPPQAATPSSSIL